MAVHHDRPEPGVFFELLRPEPVRSPLLPLAIRGPLSPVFLEASMTVALVTPSCRGEQLRLFLDAWTPVRFWDDLIVVEDGPTRTFDLATPHHYSHADVDADLGPPAWTISR